MKRLPFTFLCFSFLFRLVRSFSPSYMSCQLQKPAGEPALKNCPEGTLYVSAIDSSAHFCSVQEAIDSLPETGKAVILIGEGQYFEMINVTRAAPVVLLGQLDPATASVRSGNSLPHNIVHIWSNLYAEEYNLTDEETAILTVAPTVGHSFGNVDFKAYNIDFENRAANYSIGQALAISIELANASFYGCSFASYQDTYLGGFGSNTYVVDSTIYGKTDFLFGFGRAYFQSVNLALRGCGGGIVAWQGTPGTNNGAYISNSTIVRSPDASPDVVTTGMCFLGRPWNPYAVTVFVHTYMDDSINPAGFRSWHKGGTIPATTFYAEVDSCGPGGNTSARAKQEHILSSDQAQYYTLDEVFQGTPIWVDTEYQISKQLIPP